MKRRPGSRHTIHYLAGSMKKIGKSVGRRNCRSIAKQVMSHQRIRKCILLKVGKLLKKDMKNICSKKTSSMLRKCTPDANEIIRLERSSSRTRAVLTNTVPDA